MEAVTYIFFMMSLLAAVRNSSSKTVFTQSILFKNDSLVKAHHTSNNSVCHSRGSGKGR